jgi:hypothetical protein
MKIMQLKSLQLSLPGGKLYAYYVNPVLAKDYRIVHFH